MDWLEEFKRPFNVITLLVAVIGVSSGFYFYWISKPDRHLAYSTSEAVKVYNAEYKSPEIFITKTDGTRIDNDLYAENLRFWNSSDFDLNGSSIRHPITFDLPGIDVVDVQMTSAVPKDIAKFHITRECHRVESVTTDMEKHACFSITWDELDRNFGVKLVVFYTGQDRVHVQASGYVTGIDEIKNMTDVQTQIKPIRTTASVLLTMIIGLLLILLLWKKTIAPHLPRTGRAYLIKIAFFVHYINLLAMTFAVLMVSVFLMYQLGWIGNISKLYPPAGLN